MEQSLIQQVILDQRSDFLRKKSLIPREIDLASIMKTRQIVIISGVRRSGKSSLLYLIQEAHQISEKRILYFNFDDERLTTFESADFNKIHLTHLELFGETDYICFFDEIQNVRGWERYINRLYEKGIKVYLTGSNATLLSSEISSTLTGRNITLELLPFSFKEFLIYKKLPTHTRLSSEKQAVIKSAFQEYLFLGGFPLVVAEGNRELLHSYYQDILYKDVIARYNVLQTAELKQLTIYLASHLGKALSYNTLLTITGLKSLSSIKNYLDYLSDAFLCFLVKKFDFSLQKQILNPRKIYWVDHGLASRIGFRSSEDRGRMLENMVFIELKRMGKDLYYYLSKKECDFVVKSGNQVTEAIQVCSDLSQPETRKREMEGILSAMETYRIKEGLILTENQEGQEKINNHKIAIKPAWKWVLEK